MSHEPARAFVQSIISMAPTVEIYFDYTADDICIGRSNPDPEKKHEEKNNSEHCKNDREPDRTLQQIASA